MRKIFIAGWMVAVISGTLLGQGKYLTNEGRISFFSHTAIEDITAVNLKVACVIDAAAGEIAIIVQMTEFQFEKKLMQEHFNENYVESEKFPKARFSGRILNNSEVDYSKTGNYTVSVEGEMTIHGVTRNVKTDGTLEVAGFGIIARTTFRLNPEDYAIEIPKVVRTNIAEQMEITAELACNPV
jgi:polyisoprenoid-binding protein YceI